MNTDIPIHHKHGEMIQRFMEKDLLKNATDKELPV